MKRHTKIVATLGPASESKTTMTALVKAGMNIARLNASHGNKAQFTTMVQTLRQIEKEEKKVILTLLDLQGPKIRLGELPPEGIEVKHGDLLTFHTGGKVRQKKGHQQIPIPYAPLPHIVKINESLLIEDGLIRTKIVSIKNGLIKAKVEAGGVLKKHKGVNLPESILPAKASLSKKDRADLALGLKTLKVDAIALSFVESAKDILRVRKLMQKLSKKSVVLIAKIERPKALENLQEIAEAADGLMVARGDLGIEIPAEQVPVEQSRIIATGRALGKPVIVATQILASMTENPLPTRAEMSDAATAVLEEADAFMLSNETAVGHYPIKAVKTLQKVAKNTEKAIENSKIFALPISTTEAKPDKMNSLTKEALEWAQEINAKGLILKTKDGSSAQSLLKLRPKIPVFILATKKETARRLHFYWGSEDIHLGQNPNQIKTGKGQFVYLNAEEKKAILTLMQP